MANGLGPDELCFLTLQLLRLSCSVLATSCWAKSFALENKLTDALVIRSALSADRVSVVHRSSILNAVYLKAYFKVLITSITFYSNLL